MDESKVIMKGRLGPGMMITADLTSGQVCTEPFFIFPWCFNKTMVITYMVQIDSRLLVTSLSNRCNMLTVYFVHLFINFCTAFVFGVITENQYACL